MDVQTWWKTEELKPVQDAVDQEIQRIKIAAKFLPLPLDVISPGSTTILSDTITQTAGTLEVDQGDTTSFYQITVKFRLSDLQYSDPSGPKTAITLATRAANLLSQAEDILIFQGDRGERNSIFTQDRVKIQQRGKPSKGLLQLNNLDNNQIIHVLRTTQRFPNSSTRNRYGENTFAAVAKGYTLLQDKGHYGPYALVLHDRIYADTYAPLASTLIMPADRIKPLVTAKGINDKVSEMFYGTGTLPILDNPTYNDNYQQSTNSGGETPTGLLVSLGGNTMDLVVKTPPTVSQLPYEPGFYPFQVTEQFALRLKDTTAVIRLEFTPKEETNPRDRSRRSQETNPEDQ